MEAKIRVFEFHPFGENCRSSDRARKSRFNNGKGMLLSRIFGERYGKTVIIGDGVVGRHCARAADSMGANVYIVGRHPDRVPELQEEISGDIHFVRSTPENIAAELADADLVVGAVLRRGARAPHVVTEAMVMGMPKRTWENKSTRQ